MKSELRSQKKRGRGELKLTLLCILLSLLQKELPVLSSPATDYPKTANCQAQNVETLTAQLLRDLPSYTNRISQSVRRRTSNVDSYVLTAGRPEFAPLTLGPGIYSPVDSPQLPQQVFLTTLERQYTDGKAVELQQYHWLFLTQSSSGWRLAMMFSRIGTYPSGRPPTPPRDSSDGIIAQAIRTWLRDCQTRPN